VLAAKQASERLGDVAAVELAGRPTEARVVLPREARRLTAVERAHRQCSVARHRGRKDGLSMDIQLKGKRVLSPAVATGG
jgi:hypothetical protein